MIVNDGKKVAMRFGKGDICVNGCAKETETGDMIGYVAFFNQEPREIGSEGEITSKNFPEIDTVPMIMTFTKKESIDVVIDALIYARNAMERSV